MGLSTPAARYGYTALIAGLILFAIFVVADVMTMDAALRLAMLWWLTALVWVFFYPTPIPAVVDLRFRGQIVTQTPEESKKWEAAVAPVFDEYIKKANAKGVDGKAVVEFIKSNM